jgi:hypothetical protein
MPSAALNAMAQMMCIHGGQVMLMPSQQQVLIGGAPAITLPDIIAAKIVGCPQMGPGIVPCVQIITSMPAVMTSPLVTVKGMPLAVGTPGAPGGVTSGVPPGMIVLVNPGQVLAMA